MGGISRIWIGQWDRADSEGPAASIGATIHLVATIVAVDKDAGTVTLEGPNGRTLTVDIENPKIAKHLKVGKTVIIDYTNRLILKLDPPTS